MSIPAAHSAGPLNKSLCLWACTNRSFVGRNFSNHYRRSFHGDASSSRTAFCLDFRKPSADKNFALTRAAVLYPVLRSVMASGLFRRLAALGLLLRITRPFGVPAPKQGCKLQQRTPCKFLSGPSQKADFRHLGAGPSR